jgi:uncharacterized protein with ParB-like and HNH nuclease domain
MDLIGAWVVNFYRITDNINSTETQSVKKIKVPHYQRPYSWGPEEVKNLIDDWKEEHERGNDEEYFAGSIVTVKNDDFHSLVDGQQRFTTIFLANYLLMLILRMLIHQAIESHPNKVELLLLQLKKSLSYVSSQEEIPQFIDTNTDWARDDETIQSTVKEYDESVFLPVAAPQATYNIEHRDLLIDAFSQWSLNLEYDRQTYNESLKDSLSRVSVSLGNDANNPLELKIMDFDRDNDVDAPYLNAIYQIFDSFSEATEEKGDVWAEANETKDLITRFIKDIQLCVIQTGDMTDAYTLFEVLNDRSLGLSDLDLIKNNFYRAFCLTNEDEDELTEEDINQQINDRENQWGNQIYSNNTDDNAKLITYLATTYITGNSEIKLQTHDFRKVIDKYLYSDLENPTVEVPVIASTPYSSDDITLDFNIFQTVKIIIDEFNIIKKEKDIKAIKAEYSTDFSNTYKTVHLLRALDQNGVLAGLTNYMLNYIANKTNNFTENERVKEIVTELVMNNDLHNQVHKQAKIYWKCALLSKNHEEPLKLAKSQIQTNHRNSIRTVVTNYDNNDINKNTFTSWLEDWRFPHHHNKLKIRVMFYRLLQLEYIDEQLSRAESTCKYIDKHAGKLQLDHMEPQNPDPDKADQYYNKGYNDETRRQHVNGLGNMMPLPVGKNARKSNRAMFVIFKALEDCGCVGGHWLTTQTKEILEKKKRHTVYTNGVTTIKIPTALFFTERKTLLIDRFYEAVNEVS